MKKNKNLAFVRKYIQDTGHTVYFGRIGTEGQTKTKEFATKDEAVKDTEKRIAEKIRKGYEEKKV